MSRFTFLIASKHDPHTPCRPGAACVLSMVSRQLLPHGFCRFAHRDDVRGKAGHGLDDWMIVLRGVFSALWNCRDRTPCEPRRILVIIILYILIFNQHQQEFSPSHVHQLTILRFPNHTPRSLKVRGSESRVLVFSSAQYRESPEDEEDTV